MSARQQVSIVVLVVAVALASLVAGQITNIPQCTSAVQTLTNQLNNDLSKQLREFANDALSMIADPDQANKLREEVRMLLATVGRMTDISNGVNVQELIKGAGELAGAYPRLGMILVNSGGSLKVLGEYIKLINSATSTTGAYISDVAGACVPTTKLVFTSNGL